MNARRRRNPPVLSRRFRTARTIAAALGVWLMAAALHAQIPTGSILGGVKDAQGAAVPGATVTATNTGTQLTRTTTTDESGQYSLPLLPVGNYTIDISLPGFKSYSQSGIVLEVGRNARVDATIELGAVTETVSVVADATLVETSTSALSSTVNQN